MSMPPRGAVDLFPRPRGYRRPSPSVSGADRTSSTGSIEYRIRHLRDRPAHEETAEELS
ncbi:hypothetical protein ACGFYU_10725 [Streptomyces sp. NPDC048337]|uniref:hypothetical protein n=1 Tax=Streptomyces sp. NPDC048337 TaxID=3365535 RepID=UPI00371A1655